MKTIFYTLILALAICCKPSTNQEKSAVINEYAYPPMPESELKMLYEQTTGVDYIFHKLPFSLNQSDKSSVQSNIAMIGVNAPTLFSDDCSPLGREFFQRNGEYLYEADVYFDTKANCYAYKFFKDGKAVYLNGISTSGAKFYNQIINTDVSKYRK